MYYCWHIDSRRSIRSGWDILFGANDGHVSYRFVYTGNYAFTVALLCFGMVRHPLSSGLKQGDFTVFGAETRVSGTTDNLTQTPAVLTLNVIKTGGPFAYAEVICYFVENPRSLSVAD